MSDSNKPTEYESRSDRELTEAVVANYELSDAIIAAHPEMAQDAGFELFDTAWAKRYWRSIATEVTGISVLDELRTWAIGASAETVAELLVKHYNLPSTALYAAVALSVILIRAAKRS